MRIVATAACGIALLGASSTPAAEPTSSARVLRDFGACRAKSEPAARLACFEKTFDTFEQAVQSRQVTIVDRADVRKAKRSLFGFALPRIDLFDNGHDDPDRGRADEADNSDAFAEINTTVASAREVDGGRAEIRLADDSGAVWRTTDPMPWPPRTGDKIRIREGALGNYFLSTGGRSYRGMRVR